MVRRALIAPALGLALALASVTACATRAGLPPEARVAARGTLGYAVAFDDDALYTVELEERFRLVVRDPDTGAERARFDLGPAERDLPALAIADGAAWIGGADHQVRAVALDGGAVRATWPIGAAVTALAALPGGLIAIGDATGVVCVRRRADGALLQCVVAGEAPVRALAARGSHLVATLGNARMGFGVPALTAADTGPPPAVIVDGDAVVRDGRAVVRFPGGARAVAVGPRGQLAAVGWIRRLGDFSVVVIPVQSMR